MISYSKYQTKLGENQIEEQLLNDLYIYVKASTYHQTEISLSAKKKKSSKSGGAKKAIGVLCNEQLERALCFFGAGGHVSISGIRNL